MNLAPIILFVYNRPWHTEQTLEALMKNELSGQSTLYIFSDGPKEGASLEELEQIKGVRKLIYTKNWCKEVIVIERDKNIGLANSIINGVSEIIKRHGSVIVLEDDIVTGKYFLNFINEGLRIYKNEKQVFGVTGYCFPSIKKIKSSTFFLPVMSSWGFGTWQDRWEKINFRGEELLKMVKSKGLENDLKFGEFNYGQMLKDQVEGRNNSWAVRFYVSMILKNGVFLFPNESLLKNIGFDGTGVHCNYDQLKIHEGDYVNDEHITILKKNVRIEKAVMQKFNWKANNDNKIILKIKKVLRKIIAPEIIQLAKRKSTFSHKKDNSPFLLPRYTNTIVNLNEQEIIIPDNASFRFMYKEIFEQEIYKFKTSNPEPYIIDGGANIGLSTIYLKQSFPNAKIIAFEPDPSIFKILKNNIEVHKFDNVVLIQKGLWNKNEELNFWSEGADAGLITDLDDKRSSTLKIKTISLNEYLDRQVDFLKLDIEGAETTVLNDIQNELHKVDRIFVEYHSFVNKKQTLDEIITILTKANFRLQISTPGLSNISPFVKINVYNNMDMQLNIFGIKEGK